MASNIINLNNLNRLILFFMHILNLLVSVSPNNVSVQPMEKSSYDENSSVDFNNIKRFETELKWINFLQTALSLGSNDNIYHEGYISEMPDFDVFSLLWIC